MEFRLLGAVEVFVDGRAVKLDRGRERGLLALLLLEVGYVVPVERLIELLCGDDPPRDPRGAIQVSVSRLRRSLADAAGDGDLVRLVGHRGGYAIHCDPDSVDVHRFHTLVAHARGCDEAAERARLLREALALWRGPAVADVTSDRLSQHVRARLDEARLSALEDRVEADLAAGRHHELAPELADLTIQEPTRERLVAARMLALYRAGRQPGALEVYQRTASYLAKELGLDPSPTLRELHTAILRDDPELAAPAAAPLSPPQPASAAVRPAQLPADLSTFIGRGDELTHLLGQRGRQHGAVVISAIDGMAGAGKTALAVHAAHGLAPSFPDGQLFLDLHGFTEGVDPVDPAEALDRMLRSLGVPGGQVPAAVEERAAMYRDLLADRRALLLLDNAADEAQVRPLLPAAATCLVLITSRRRLTGLDDTYPISLSVLPRADAVALFTRIVGADRLAGAPAEQVAEVVELCGRLPLAIRIAAARLHTRPAWTLSHLVERLDDQQQRLVELEAGQRSVATAIHLSYQHLDAAQGRMFRLLGLHPGPDIDTYAAAALADASWHRTERLLGDLLDAHLLDQHEPNRYRFHDLIRAQATQTCAREEPEPQRGAALARLCDYYGHTAATAIDVLYPSEAEHRPSTPTVDTPTPSLVEEHHASAWVDAELANLLATAAHAADHDQTAYVLHLSATLRHHLRTRAHFPEAETLHTHALRAARRIGHPSGEVTALAGLGDIYRARGEHEAAADRCWKALNLARDIAYPAGELDALNGLGHVHLLQDRYGPAADCYEQALSLARDIAHPAGELNALNGLGRLHRLQSYYGLAADYSQQALFLAREIGDRSRELRAVNGVGFIHFHQGRYGSAVDCFDQALGLAEAIGDRFGELMALDALAAVHRARSEHGPAGNRSRQILEIAREIGNRNYQFEALHGLGQVHLATDDRDQALTNFQQAIDIAEALGQRDDQARTHNGLARTRHALGQHERARHHWEHALAILTDLGLTEVEEINTDEIRDRLANLR